MSGEWRKFRGGVLSHLKSDTLSDLSISPRQVPTAPDAYRQSGSLPA